MIEPIYPAEEKLSRTEELSGTHSVGSMLVAERIECIGTCCIRVPVKYGSVIEEAGSIDDEMSPVLGIIPLMWRGLEIPCRCCYKEPVPKPTGVSCIDTGRNVTTVRCDMQKLMELTNTDDPSELKRRVDAECAAGRV
jgi:hypothetical protein